MKSDEKVLLEWTSDEIQFNGMVFTRAEFDRLAHAIHLGYDPEQLAEHKFAATYLNWEKVRELRDLRGSHTVPEITAQFLARFWNLDELIFHAKFKCPSNMPKLDDSLPF